MAECTCELTLEDFILRRLEETASLARAAAVEHQKADWHFVGEGCPTLALTVGEHGAGTIWHITRHDPVHVLADCEAKRRLVARLSERLGECYDLDELLGYLALPYANHQDYRPEWRP